MDPPSTPKFIGAVKDDWLMYSDNPEDYTRLSPIGFGASSVVYQAIHHHKDGEDDVKDIPCALKVLNLDKLQPSALRLLTRETQLMSLSKHPNVLRVRGSWMMGPQLYIAMRLMNSGSVTDIMKYSFIDGLEEDVVICILHQALQGLNYLHVNGFVHRDIKGANLLVDEDGTVLLGDLGVAVSLADEEGTGQNGIMSAVRKSMHSGGLGGAGGGPLVFGVSTTTSPGVRPASKGSGSKDSVRLKKRRSFVGTPSWMAPEVITQQHYDYSADIWSLGITVLEMCAGRAPGSRQKDVKKVLMATLQNLPPTLERNSGEKKYSKALKDFVDSCLQKDPAQRPTAEQLLQHQVFKGVKKKSYLVNTLLSDLPPLANRQERRLVNQSPSMKGHQLALGSPSVVSTQGLSWDWTFSNPGSPRSTYFAQISGIHKRESSGGTHPNSARSPGTGRSPSDDSLLGSLRSPKGGAGAGRSRAHSLTKSIEIPNKETLNSSNRTQSQSNVTAGISRVLDQRVAEGDDDESVNGADAVLQRHNAPGISISRAVGEDGDDDDDDDDEGVPETPQILPQDPLTDDVTTLEDGSDIHVPHPPELSSSISSSAATSNMPETPPTSAPVNTSISQSKFMQSRSRTDSSSELDLGLPSRPIPERSQTSSTARPKTAPADSSGKSKGLWKKVKGLTLSSKKN
ncbi:hypothetical protein FRB94_007801 [Tulasnella sp. JGI-2019a]|nr:hypothetical protein FRB93_004334 [Tulasnella sp. JGI-2019a]KAG8997230.1 hypothetical protein FRB94_007801 [Tulasnella sp. JGI-2019a]KAG9027854.1 hypothetical protein FRB95_007335 [Tulasnella sp. JGI-2019a]